MALPNDLAPAEPVLPLGTVRGRGHPPVRELLPVDEPGSTEGLRVLAFVVAADHGHRPSAGVGHQLDGQGTEPAAAAPHQHDITRLDRVGRPSEEHAVGRGAGQGGGGGFLPREEVRLRHALVGLHLRELCEGPPARVVAPHAEGPGEAGVLARLDPGVVCVPLAGVHHHAVAHLDVRDLIAHRVDDTRCIRAHDVEVGGLAPSSLGLGDVHRRAAGSPHVVVVHPRGHDHDERIVRPELGHVDHLVLDRRLGLAVPVGSHELRMHLRRHIADRWDLTDLEQVLAHGISPFRAVSDAER